MSAGRDENDAGKAVEQALRRQASSADNRRDIARMPQFQVEQDLPKWMTGLLGQLDRAERQCG